MTWRASPEQTLPRGERVNVVKRQNDQCMKTLAAGEGKCPDCVLMVQRAAFKERWVLKEKLSLTMALALRGFNQCAYNTVEKDAPANVDMALDFKHSARVLSSKVGTINKCSSRNSPHLTAPGRKPGACLYTRKRLPLFLRF